MHTRTLSAQSKLPLSTEPQGNPAWPIVIHIPTQHSPRILRYMDQPSSWPHRQRSAVLLLLQDPSFLPPTRLTASPSWLLQSHISPFIDVQVKWVCSRNRGFSSAVWPVNARVEATSTLSHFTELQPSAGSASLPLRPPRLRCAHEPE